MLDTAWQQRASAFLLGVFAALALALATVGIYGVTAYTVGQRRREFGVRRALGAQRADLALVVLPEVARTPGIGLAAGLGLALIATRAVRPLLYGVAPIDALTNHFRRTAAALGHSGCVARACRTRGAD
jgi:ABC-type antimicrobial peptide transport system permease subunit